MKLYILVRKDLSKSQQAVQAGHAVAKFLLENKNHSWENGTLVFLGVEDEFQLATWKVKFTLSGIESYTFNEPYWNDEMTAMAVYHPRAEEMLKELELL